VPQARAHAQQTNTQHSARTRTRSTTPAHAYRPAHECRTVQHTARRQGHLYIWWASEGSRRDECNLRGPATANAQKGSYVTRVDWTPIIARGKLSIYVGAADEAEHDQSLPKKLADAFHLAMEQILAPAVHLAPSILMAIAACSCARSSQGSTRFENKLHKC